MRAILNLYREAFAGLPRAAWILSLIVLVNRSGTMVLVFLSLYFTQALEFTTEQAGFLLGLYGVGALAGTYLGGWLTDRIGPVRVQLSSLLLSGAGFFLLGQMRSLLAVGATLLLLSLLAEAFRPANATLLMAVCPSARRAKAYALHRLAINAGMTIGPVVGGILAMIDFSWLFLVDGATCIAAAGLLWAFAPAAGEGALARETRDEPADRRSPWRDKVFLWCLLLACLEGLIFMQIISTLPLYLNAHYGLAKNQIGLVFATNTTLIIALEMLIVHRLEKRPPLPFIALGALLTGTGFGLTGCGSSFAFALLTIAVWTFGEMLGGPLLASFIANRADDRNRGRYMGLYGLSFSLSFVLAAPLGTAVYESWGPEALWGGCAALGMLIALGFLLVPHSSPER